MKTFKLSNRNSAEVKTAEMIAAKRKRKTSNTKSYYKSYVS